MGRRKSGAAGGLAAFFALCVVSLALFTVYVKEGDCATAAECGPLHTVQLGAAEVLRPVRGAVGTVSEPVAETGERVQSALDKGDEERLERRVRELEELAADNSRLASENARLRELVNGEREAYRYGPLGQVVAPVGDQFAERVMINVGTEDGVEANKPVVIGDSTLVGRTADVSKNTARIVLVTDQEFAAGVRVVPPAEFDPASGELTPAVTDEDVPFGEGALATDLEGNLGVEFVPRSSRAEEGDYVVTSGRTGNRESLYPPGLLVGAILSSSSQDIEQYKTIVVDPAMDPEDLQEVRVILDW